MARIINTAELDFSILSADENHWIYNGLDCCVTFDVFENLAPILDDVAMKTYEFSKALQAPVAEMCLRGMLVNKVRKRKILTEFRKTKSQLEEQYFSIVNGVFGTAYSWSSPHQVKQLLYNVMGLPVQKKRGVNGWGPTVDRDALEKLESIYHIARPVINHILALRDLQKSIGFLETAMDPDGRMRTDLKIAGTSIGRFSSSETDFGTGTNLQNVTEKLRSVFVADKGFKFANLDLEQGDSRNVGALCWDILVDNPDWNEASAGRYLDACESGDLHTTVAKMTLKHLPWGTDTDRAIAEAPFYRHHNYRHMCKILGHGSNYLGQPVTMAKHSKFPVQDVKNFQHQYFNAFPCITAYHEWVKYQLEHFSQITTPYGRRRFFFGRPKDSKTHRDATAFAPASMTAEAINIGILKLWRANRVQLLMQVHDSILFQYPEEEEDEIIPWALKELETHLTLKRGRDFFIPTEAKIGWNWGNHADDNPDGLTKWKGSDDRKRTETEFQLSLLGV